MSEKEEFERLPPGMPKPFDLVTEQLRTFGEQVARHYMG